MPNTSHVPIAQLIQAGRFAHCTPDTPIVEAARQMREMDCSAMVVADDGNPVGIWTERDALRVDPDDAATLHAPIEEVMSTPVLTIAADQTREEATSRFHRDGVRHLLVVDPERGAFLGVISQTDLARDHGFEAYIQLRDVSTALHGSALRVSSGAGLQRAACLMDEANRSAALVDYPDGGPGIVTERDILSALAAERGKVTIGDVASRPLVVTDARENLVTARTRMIESGVRHIGVTDEHGAVIGLISFEDLVGTGETALLGDLDNALRDRERELEEARRRLHLGQRHYRGLFEHAPIGIAELDLDGVLCDVNPAFQRMVGYPRDEVVGRPCLDFIDPEYHQRCLALWATLTSGRRNNFTLDGRYLSLANGSRAMEMTAALIRDAEGVPESILAMCLANPSLDP